MFGKLFSSMAGPAPSPHTNLVKPHKHTQLYEISCFLNFNEHVKPNFDQFCSFCERERERERERHLQVAPPTASLAFILGGAPLPSTVPASAGLTIEALDMKMAELVTLAPPEFSFNRLAIVQQRFNRTSTPREELVRTLEAVKALRLQEYDREASVRAIDAQWLTLRQHRHLLQVAARRQRHASPQEEQETPRQPEPRPRSRPQEEITPRRPEPRPRSRSPPRRSRPEPRYRSRSPPNRNIRRRINPIEDYESEIEIGDY